MTREVLEILNILNSAGHEAYLVGGSVRDFCLGKTPTDYDITTAALPEEIMKIFQEEESIRQNREESENFRNAFSEPVLSEPLFPEGEIKAKPYRSLPQKPDSISDRPKLPANKLSNKIQVLHSVFDQSAEMNE